MSETLGGKRVYRMACKLTMTKRVFYSFTFISPPRFTSLSPSLSLSVCLGPRLRPPNPIDRIRVSSISIANV